MTDPDRLPVDVVRTVPEGQVVYGMQLPIQSQSTLYVAEWEKQAGPAELGRIAQVADESGFFYIGVCDHTAIPARLADAMGTIWYDTTATLGWLAALTTRTHLLSHVLILAQRHPLRAAKELATLDLLSGGRLIVGVGAGHVPEEYELLTGEFAERGRHTDEAVSALALAFTSEFPELPGPRFPASGMGIAPRPVRQPRPPIWIGGSSPAAIRRTAAYGDGWLPQGTRRRDLPEQIARLRALARGTPRRRTDRHRHHRRAHPSRHRGTRNGTSPATCSRAASTRSPRHCANSWPWASTTSRCASWPAQSRSSASKRRRSGPRSGHSWPVDSAAGAARAAPGQAGRRPIGGGAPISC